ncbi:MAG TPA: gamma-glutamyltransferase [Candidatus Baltobacteraceae bacterium]|nr:gamma-glutamyltransferase [Candidatus Baltobacteraceae bacterium]
MLKGLCTGVAALLLLAASGASQPRWQSISPAVASHAMVVTEQHDATEAGVATLRHGGNAVDAAIAVAYALAVVDPCCGNIGGGGFMLVRMHDGRERFIDFREKAPLRANPRMYLDAKGNVIPRASTKGYLAVGIPGTVMGMERAREEFGTLPRSVLMAPAIALAKNGFVVWPGDAAIFKAAGEDRVSGAYTFANQPNERAIFMHDGHLPQNGEVLRQPQLAATLELIAKDGASAFYDGPIAKKIVEASYKGGGMLSMDDFAKYTVDEQTPVHCRYRGYDVISAAPPSSGGVTLCETLDILSAYPLHDWGWHSAESAHYVVEAERRAYADRNTYLGDPSFVKNPVAELLSQTYAAKLRASIAPEKATPSAQVHPGLGTLAHENDDTTHFSIVDKWGNAVAVTYTINDWFGAGVIAEDTGFFLNDEMDDFTSKPGVPNMFGLVQGVRNDIEPGKRPLSSMAPTIVTKNGKLFMVTGSPGGSRIITIVLSTLQNVIDYGMNVQQAVNAPRLHMQWLPDRIDVEPGALNEATRRELQSMGYTFKQIPAWGSAQAIVVDQRNGKLYGGTDRRHPAGLAAGY